MNGFSEYFTLKELTDSEHHPEMVAQNRLDAKQYLLAGKRLSKLLESIRHILGDKPIKVTSGYRNARLNKAVGSVQDGKGGRKLSSHCRFEAADIKPEMNLKEAFNALMMAHKGGLLPDLRKCIIEKNAWLHCECSMFVGDYKGFLVSHDGITFEKVA